MSSTKKIKVLLIDDSKAVNKRNASILEDTDFFSEIKQFNSVDHAIAYLKTCNAFLPDLILLDINMPNKNGFDFLNEYSELENIVKSDFTPIITMVSDHLGFENFDKSKYYKMFGVLDHLKKPIDKEDMEGLINDHFRND